MYYAPKEFFSRCRNRPSSLPCCRRRSHAKQKRGCARRSPTSRRRPGNKHSPTQDATHQTRKRPAARSWQRMVLPHERHGPVRVRDARQMGDFNRGRAAQFSSLQFSHGIRPAWPHRKQPAVALPFLPPLHRTRSASREIRLDASAVEEARRGLGAATRGRAEHAHAREGEGWRARSPKRGTRVARNGRRGCVAVPNQLPAKRDRSH